MDNQYEFRHLRLEDYEAFQKLTGDAYYPDTDVCKTFDFKYEELCDMGKALDFPHFVKTGVTYGAFYEGKLVSSVMTQDVLDFGEEQQVNEKTGVFFQMCVDQIDDFLKDHNFKKGECFRVCLLQTHPDHRQKKLAKTLLQLCYNEWKQRNFKWAVLEALHIGTQKAFFSLSKKQHILKTNQEYNGKPLWIQGEAIEIEYD